MVSLSLAATLMFWAIQTPAPLAKEDFVQLERTECFGSCPAYTVRVHADGRVVWQGKLYVQIPREATSTIAPAAAQALIEKFRTEAFWNLRGEYSAPVTDNPTFITTAHIGDKEKRVSDYAYAAPSLLHDLEIEIDVVADTHRWIHGEPRTELMTSSNIRADGVGSKPGVTALMKASVTADTAEIQKLLAAKSDPNARDVSGWTALVYAAQGAKIGRVDAATYSSGIESVKLLLDAGANPDARSFMDQTPIMAAVAAYYSPVEKTKLLIAAKVDVNAQDKNGQTAIMQFVRGALGRNLIGMYQQQVELLSALRAAGARTDLRDSNGLTVLDLLDRELQRWLTASGSANEKAAMQTQYEQLRKVLQN